MFDELLHLSSFANSLSISFLQTGLLCIFSEADGWPAVATGFINPASLSLSLSRLSPGATRFAFSVIRMRLLYCRHRLPFWTC